MSKSDDFFDFNHDGKLDALEWSAKMEFLDEVSKDRPEYHRGRSGSRASSSGKVGTGRPAGRSGAGRPAGKPGVCQGDASGDTLLGARVCQEIRPRDTRNLRRA